MSDQGQPGIPAGFNFDAGFSGAGQQQPPSGGSDSGLANDFLARVPEADREVVGRYVKDWDAGVTRRFQDIYSRFEPYQQLGDYETLMQYKAVYDYLKDNPQAVYKTLHETFGQQQPTEESADEYGELPPAVVDRLKMMDQQGQLLQALAERVIGMNNANQEAQEDADLDRYMNWLSSQYGSFDEDYVLAKMQTGMDGVKAVEEFQQKYGGQQQRQPFTVLSGGGAVGQQGNFNPAKASSQDVKTVVSEMLRFAQEQGR
jgi:hypothetical protein